MYLRRIVLVVLIAFAGVTPDIANARRSTSSPSAAPQDISTHVAEAAHRFGLPEHWIYAVIRAESAGRVKAVSHAGAMGLMQLMPGTWTRQRNRYGLGSDPFDPRDNILAGTSYLREMYDRFGENGFLAAYNAGPGRYEDWLAGRRNLPLETRRYVARIAAQLQLENTVTPPAMQQTRGLPIRPGAPSSPLSLPVETGTFGPSLNPFARPAQAAHDLFAPVAAASER